MAAVAAAEPTGRAMAVVRTDEQYGQGRVELIGVQSELLGNVAMWRGKDAAALEQVGRQLREGAGKPAAVDGDILLRVNASGLGELPLRLGAMISAIGQPPTVVWLGDIKAGQKDYAGPLPGCVTAGTCRFAGLALGRVAARRADRSGPRSPCRRCARPVPPAQVRLSEPEVWQTDNERNPAAKVTVQPGTALNLTVESDGAGRRRGVLSGHSGEAAGVSVRAGAGRRGRLHLPGLRRHAAGFHHRGALRDGCRAPATTRSCSTSTWRPGRRRRRRGWPTRPICVMRSGLPASAGPALATKLADQGIRVVGTQTMDGELEQLVPACTGPVVPAVSAGRHRRRRAGARGARPQPQAWSGRPARRAGGAARHRRCGRGRCGGHCAANA